LKRDDETAIRAWLDGQFGDPFDIARGKLVLGDQDIGANHLEARHVFSRIAEDLRPSASCFAQILNRARTLITELRFQNWQVAFPGVWKQWESGSHSSPSCRGARKAIQWSCASSS
jgi:hypothetical protein